MVMFVEIQTGLEVDDKFTTDKLESIEKYSDSILLPQAFEIVNVRHLRTDSTVFMVILSNILV